MERTEGRMGRVYLCLGKNAEVPYYFERVRTHVWNVEELCYFVRENAWLLEPSVLGRELAAWVGEQCNLPELSRALLAAIKKEDPVQAFVRALFLYTGYCSMEEADQVEKILRVNESSSALERAKARGDYFLESKKYVLALQEYETLLQGLTGMEPGFLGRVYHNCGVVQAQLFLFDQAADCFERSWKLTRDKESARQFLAAKRFALSEQEYVDFLAQRPDLYEASLALEERVEKCNAAWEESEDADFVRRAQKAKKDGAAHISRQMIAERIKPLQDAYRGYVVK